MILRLLLDSGTEVNATCNLYQGGATTMGMLLTSIHPARAEMRSALKWAHEFGRTEVAEYLTGKGA